jgi:hypothetical protein
MTEVQNPSQVPEVFSHSWDQVKSGDFFLISYDFDETDSESKELRDEAGFWQFMNNQERDKVEVGGSCYLIRYTRGHSDCNGVFDMKVGL